MYLVLLIKRYWLIISVMIFSLIALLSLTPLAQLPSAPGSDKAHHFIAYGVLFFPIALAKPKYWIVIGLLFAGLSGVIELTQPLVNRYGEWFDMLANCFGLFCGFIVAHVTNKMIK